MNNKFNKGDEVICLPESKWHLTHTNNEKGNPGKGFEEGLVFIIDTVIAMSNSYCYFPKKGSGVYEGALAINEPVECVKVDWDELRNKI